MEGKKIKQNLPLKLHNNSLPDDPQKAELLATNFFAKIGCHPTLHPPTDFHEVINNATSNPVIPELAQPFTEKEIDEAIATLKPRKIARHDLIPYEFLTHLTSSFKKAFLNIYNSSWLLGDFPSCWKKSVVLLILKSEKDPTSPSSYIGKLFERLACTRLSWWLEEKQLTKEEQCGFRPRRGTLDILAQIEYHICDTYRKKQVMTTLFVDLEGTFDTAAHESILYKQAKMGLTGTTLTWIKNFLTTRTFQVAVGASRSSIYSIKRGVPQESINIKSTTIQHITVRPTNTPTFPSHICR